jgi:hypothetical protein
MRIAERILQNSCSENDADNHSPQVQKLLAEWDQDRAMARERYETSKKPANRPLEVMDAPARSERSNRVTREQSKGIDIPF